MLSGTVLYFNWHLAWNEGLNGLQTWNVKLLVVLTKYVV